MNHRSGFTLLEVLLASLIATLLMAALYVAMEVQLRQANDGREVIERATLSRAIINRLTLDLTPSVTPPRAKPKKGSSSSSTSSSSTSSTTGSTSGTTTTGSTTDMSSSMNTTEQVTSVIPLQAGVIGTEFQLVIYTTRTPDPRENGMDTMNAVPSDLRRISYWISENGGLCRQEIPWVTGETVYGSTDPILDGEKPEEEYIIAPEATEVTFAYYDINAVNDNEGWLTEWDGSTSGPDGRTPLGPPSAIRVNFTLRTTDAQGELIFKQYSHVIPIVTASGPTPTPESEMPPADGTMTTTMP
ncbi:MAG: prepilin-type N-terminal cleavage/methylation domain-containing protein [Planctomycetes bacterium]|nr:prepilin-type N-terminal cleavage/methylation domain-containing protein [Planctomycetota bacterium]